LAKKTSKFADQSVGDASGGFNTPDPQRKFKSPSPVMRIGFQSG